MGFDSSVDGRDVWRGTLIGFAFVMHILYNQGMFLPTTAEEVHALGWDGLDIILVTGDSYIDSPFIGAALLGKLLLRAGFRVGILAQPDVKDTVDMQRLGEPRLFWGVTAGSVDSMVANYTASGRKRKQDDYTPGGENSRRPDRASIVYANLIRRCFKNTRPIVLGGIEASLRRVAHYDYWSNALRRSLLLDAKADYLLYGMADLSVVELAQRLHQGQEVETLRGLCYLSRKVPEGYIPLPSYEAVVADKSVFTEMFHVFYQNNDPLTAKGLAQKHGDRWLVQNPPYPYPNQAELDGIYNLEFERAQHPYYERMGTVKALETIRFSISTHRGCYGECNFCAIAVHEGRTVRWRSADSVVAEARQISQRPDFKGYLLDVGGPTANMYGFECEKKLRRGACVNRRCLFPEVCAQLHPDHRPQLALLSALRKIPGVKKVFVASGVRYDLVLEDGQAGQRYLETLVEHHVSGQLKVAPEHSEPQVLRRMGKPGVDALLQFKRRFDALSQTVRKQQYLTYYLIAAYPGCSEAEMRRMKRFASEKLHIAPEQVQIFTPTPSTYASLMYYTERDPWTGEILFVEKTTNGRERQKRAVVGGG